MLTRKDICLDTGKKVLGHSRRKCRSCKKVYERRRRDRLKNDVCNCKSGSQEFYGSTLGPAFKRPLL